MSGRNLRNQLPNLFILGAAKCGTTSLAHYLGQHPEIFVPWSKEPHFFDDDRFYYNGFDFYARKFYRFAGNTPIRVDATPAYFHKHSWIIPRIQLAISSGILDPSFIIIFRDPVERAISHYRHMVRSAKEDATFSDALTFERERMAADPNSWYGYFQDGLYASQLDKWLAAFGRERFFLVNYEDLKNNPTGLLTELFQFLGVDDSFSVPDLTARNRASHPRSMALMKLLAKRWPRFLTFWIPPLWKFRIRLMLQKANLRLPSVGTDYEPIDQNVLTYLRGAYYRDVKALEKRTGWSLDHWTRS